MYGASGGESNRGIPTPTGRPHLEPVECASALQTRAAAAMLMSDMASYCSLAARCGGLHPALLSAIAASVASKRRLSPATETRPRAKRRNLTEEHKAELCRLYSQTAMPLPEIKQRFGVAESSIYRLLQQRDVAVRGRIPRAEAAVAKAANEQQASLT